jgi:F-type H+-transporting ATPase subunit gamma
VRHPPLRQPSAADRTHRIALVVISSNRGLAGAYNGSVLRAANAFIREQEKEGKTVELYVAGKKGVSYFNFQKRPITQRYDQFGDMPRFADVRAAADFFTDAFVGGRIDALHVASMNFLSAGVQRPQVQTLLPLATPKAKEPAGAGGAAVLPVYDFYPSAQSLLDELLPLTLRTALFQCFLDATTSENVARMVAMKSATDNADKMGRALAMRYNRARQSQITTELSEIMGGVEAMKGA